MEMEVYSNGESFEVVKSSESDERYVEFDILREGESIGSVSKYAEDHVFTAWDEDGQMVCMRKTLKGAVNAIIKRWEVR